MSSAAFVTILPLDSWGRMRNEERKTRRRSHEVVGSRCLRCMAGVGVDTLSKEGQVRYLPALIKAGWEVQMGDGEIVGKGTCIDAGTLGCWVGRSKLVVVVVDA